MVLSSCPEAPNPAIEAGPAPARVIRYRRTPPAGGIVTGRDAASLFIRVAAARTADVQKPLPL